MMLIVAFTFLAVVFLSVVGIWYRWRFRLDHLVGHAVLMLAFVALTYFLFITFIVKEFFLVDENFVKYSALKSLAAKSKEHT